MHSRIPSWGLQGQIHVLQITLAAWRAEESEVGRRWENRQAVTTAWGEATVRACRSGMQRSGRFQVLGRSVTECRGELN